MLRTTMLAMMLAAGLTAGGCFNPDLGPGGFHCDDSRGCPEGYECLPDNPGDPKHTARRCWRDGVQPEPDMGPPPDGPGVDQPLTDAVPDGPIVEPICTPPRVIGNAPSAMPPSFDLTVDSDTLPHIALVNTSGDVDYHWCDDRGAQPDWHQDGVKPGAGEAIEVALAAQSRDKGPDSLHLFYYAQAGTSQHVYHLTGTAGSTSAVFGDEVDLMSIGHLPSTAIPGRVEADGEGPVVGLAVSYVDTNGMSYVQATRILRKPTGVYERAKCDREQTTDAHAPLAIAAAAPGLLVGLRDSLGGGSKMRYLMYKWPLKDSSCPPVKKAGFTDKGVQHAVDARVAVALTNHASMLRQHTAFGYPGGAAPLAAPLYYASWDIEKQQLLGPKDVASAVVPPEIDWVSVDMDETPKGEGAVISATRSGSLKGPDVPLLVYRVKTAWKTYELERPTHFRATPGTRVVWDGTGDVHVVYSGVDSSSGSDEGVLVYMRCAL